MIEGGAGDEPELASDLDADIAALIGVAQYVAPPVMAANEPNVRAMCAAVENGNPAWWDEDAGRELLGGAYCPATMLPVWGRPDVWQPGEGAPPKALQAHFDLKDRLGFPASVAVSYTTSFFAPVAIGDALATQQMIRSIGPVKTTRLGTGRFWTVEMQYLGADGAMIGIESYEFFGFVKDAA
ncbi:MAG: hypothetical protein R3E02_10580 [Blastomonas sp.]